MTSIFIDQSEGPKLHAFIIGVGAYNHLQGGSSPGKKLNYDMGQLLSAPVSALSFAQWLIDEYSGPTPLGSIEILISDDNDVPRLRLKNGTEAIINDRANSETIRQAFKRWRKRCDGIQIVNGAEVKPPADTDASVQNNIAFFYFCGHGFEKGNVYLLLEDFGEDEDVLFANSINFHQTYAGMKQSRAQTQCYFVDCCRGVPKALTERSDVQGITLIDPILTLARAREAPIIFSTMSNTTAWAPPAKEMTRFTHTLIDCLKGSACDTPTQGSWNVTTGSLISAMTELLNAQSFDGQVCTSEGEWFRNRTVLGAFKEPPIVEVTVCTKPASKIRKLKFKITNSILPAEHERAKPENKPWVVNVRAAEYLLEAHDVEIAKQAAREARYILPPKRRWELDLK